MSKLWKNFYLSALILIIPSWPGMSIAAWTSSAPPSTLLSSSGLAEELVEVVETGELGLDDSALISAAIITLLKFSIIINQNNIISRKKTPLRYDFFVIVNFFDKSAVVQCFSNALSNL